MSKYLMKKEENNLNNKHHIKDLYEKNTFHYSSIDSL